MKDNATNIDMQARRNEETLEQESQERTARAYPHLSYTTFAIQEILWIDNESGKATDCIRKILEIVNDLFTPENRDYIKFYEFSTRLDIFVDGEYFKVDIYEDEGMSDALCSKLLAGKKIRTEAIQSDRDGKMETSFYRQLESILEGGQLSDCVTVCSYLRSWSSKNEDENNEEIACADLLIDGMYKGKYLRGPIPYEEDREAMRTLGGWVLLGEENEGLRITLRADAPAAALRAIRKHNRELSKRLSFDGQMVLRESDFSAKIEELYAETRRPVLPEDQYHSILDSLSDESEKAKFKMRYDALMKKYDAPFSWNNIADLRPYFPKEVAGELVGRYPRLMSLLTQHLDEACDPELLDKARLAWCVHLCEKREAELIKKYVPEDILLSLSIEGGMGDLFNRSHEYIVDLVRSGGYYVTIDRLLLNGIEDVDFFCEYLNSILDIVRTAGVQVDEIENARDLDESGNPENTTPLVPIFEYAGLVDPDEAEADAGTIYLTNRDYIRRSMESKTPTFSSMCKSSPLLEFVPENASVYAKLRIRIIDGRFVPEIAQPDADS